MVVMASLTSTHTWNEKKTTYVYNVYVCLQFEVLSVYDEDRPDSPGLHTQADTMFSAEAKVLNIFVFLLIIP